MEENTLVSVVIPTYNREHLIKNTIDSVLKQTYQNFEIIVVDDGSTDNTKDVVEKINDNRIKYVYKNNSGAQATRNIGIKNAKGDWIAFLDSDDEWLPDKLENQIAILSENNFDKHIVIHSNAILRDKIKNEERIFNIPKVEGYIYKDLLSHPAPLFPSLLTSKKALEEIGYLDENCPSYQEWDTSIRLSKICRFVYMDKPTFIYYYHDGETISKGLKRDIEGYNYIINKFKNEIIKNCSKKCWINHVMIQYNKCLDYNLKQQASEILKMLPISYKLKSFVFKKERIGNRRKITLLGFIKISYKK